LNSFFIFSLFNILSINNLLNSLCWF